MYSLGKRTKAVLLFVESDCSESTVICTLGYPSPNALRNWYKEYLSAGNTLHANSAPKPRYTEQQKAAAVAYFATHRVSLTRACRAMGYPSRNKLRQWILESRPELLEKATWACTTKKAMVRCSQKQKQAAVETMLVDGVPAYKVADTGAACQHQGCHRRQSALDHGLCQRVHAGLRAMCRPFPCC